MPTTVPIDGYFFVVPRWESAVMAEVMLRPVHDEDLDTIFEHTRDPDSVRMAAFTHKDPDDRAAFDAHWARIRARPDVTLRAIVADGTLAGTISSFVLEGDTEAASRFRDRGHRHRVRERPRQGDRGDRPAALLGPSDRRCI
jgi:hypothetical protein